MIFLVFAFDLFMLIVLTTTPNLIEAEDLAKKIIEAKLAVCVQILPQMKSIYYWNDKVQNEPEHLLLIKTLSKKYSEIEKFIQANHSYEVPEIIAISAENVSKSYLSWVNENLGQK